MKTLLDTLAAGWLVIITLFAIYVLAWLFINATIPMALITGITFLYAATVWSLLRLSNMK